MIKRPAAYLLFVLTVIAVCAAAVLAEAREDGEVQQRLSPHDPRNPAMCSVCHGEEPPALLLDPVTTCVKCHHGNIGNHPVTRHPMGLVTRIKIPARLPLTEDGEMVCYTCHDPHGKSTHPRMLRIDYLGLCAACHVGY